MKVYIHIGSGGVESQHLVAPLTEAIQSSSLHKHIVGCGVQINSGYSNELDIFDQDAERTLEIAPRHPEVESSIVTGSSGEFAIPGLQAIARNALSQDFPYEPKFMFLNHEPYNGTPPRFDAAERPFRPAELWFVARCIATLRFACRETLGHALPCGIWNTPGWVSERVDWEAVEAAYKEWGLGIAFINEYQQYNSPLSNFKAIRDNAEGMRRLKLPLYATMTPRDLGTPGEFSQVDQLALSAKLMGLRYEGIDRIYYWMNAAYIGDDEGNVDQKKFDTILAHAHSLGDQLDKVKA